MYTWYFPILFENYKITNLTMYRHYDYYKYYKITDITNYSNNYILVCQSNAERKLQNYNPYKHLYNQHMKKNKKIQPYKHYKKLMVKKCYAWCFPLLFGNYKITNLTSIYTINT